MAPSAHNPEANSLTSRLIVAMLIPLSLLAVVIGAGGSWATGELVEAVNDRILSAASHAISDSLNVENGKIEMSLSPAIFGMLENNERDNVYYSIRYKGEVLTGYSELRDIGTGSLGDAQVRFGKGDFRGRPIRVVAEARKFAELDAPVIIQVAETLDARQRISNRMLYALAGIELAMIAVVVGLLPFAVRWGLRPLETVCHELDVRAASDLAPLDARLAPREVRMLVDAFNRMLGRLDAAVEGMRRFTADASHQMRTPLAILRTHIGLLRHAPPGSKVAQDALTDIDEASRRLQHLLVQLLALARADAATPAIVSLTTMNLNEIAASVAEEIVPEAVDSGVELYFEEAEGAAIARGHPDLARELLANLVDNAVRYNRAGGNVMVRVSNAGGGPTVIIEDDGPGIAPADRHRVFDRFTRLARKEPVSGSGLGLSIALSLANAIGARIELRTPASGRGLEVAVSFDPA